MSWWNLPDSKNEWMGDSSADAASVVLAPLAQLNPKPSVDQILDALEVVLRDGALVSDEALGERTLSIRDRPRHRTLAQASLVETLLQGMPRIVASYRKHFQRAPILRELVYSISFVFVADVAEYTSDEIGELYYIQIIG